MPKDFEVLDIELQEHGREVARLVELRQAAIEKRMGLISAARQRIRVWEQQIVELENLGGSAINGDKAARMMSERELRD